MAEYHVRAGRASQATGRAHRWTKEEAAEARMKAAGAMDAKYGERALRSFLNDVEYALRHGVPYQKAEILSLFHGLMEDRGYAQKGTE